MNATEVSTIINTSHNLPNSDRGTSSMTLMSNFQEHHSDSSHIIKEESVREMNNYHLETVPTNTKNSSLSKEESVEMTGNTFLLEPEKEKIGSNETEFTEPEVSENKDLTFDNTAITEQNDNTKVKDQISLSSSVGPKNETMAEDISTTTESSSTTNMSNIPLEEVSESPISAIPSQMTPLIKEQLKYCANIVRSLKRHRDASPFLQPVDPVALGIPDYFEVVKRPMDLSTISNKLTEQKYENPDQFIDDVRLMLSNCFAYNQPSSIVHTMGKNVEKVFENLLKKMPTAAPVTPSKVPPTASPTSSSTVAVMEEVDEERPRRSMAGAKRRSSLEEERTPKQRKESIVHSPPTSNRSSINSQRKSNLSPGSAVSTAAEDLKYCHHIIKELTKKSNQSCTWPFLQPVDPIALGIPDYLTVIKHPMDISTIKRKLDMKSYSTSEDFKSDFYLMCQNCYTYNTPDTEVVRLCKTMEGIFNDLWAKRPTKNLMEETSDSEDEKKIVSITRKIAALEAELEEIRKRKGAPSAKRKSVTSTPMMTNSVSSTATPLSGKKGKPGRPTGSIKKEKPMESYRPMTFEEKRQLSLDINDLPQERLGKVVEIIHACMPRLKESTNSDEIELDIDQLDAKTLHSLAKYVRQVKTGKLEEKKRNKHSDMSSINTPSKSARPGTNQGLNLSSSEDESNDEY